MFIESLERMSYLFSNVAVLRLMGGEPLLNPDLNKFVVESRKVFPKSEIRIVTNGLLLNNLSGKLADSMKKSGAIFDITQYPPTRAIMSTIIDVLRKTGVDYSVSPPVKEFEIRMSKGDSEPSSVFDCCEYKTCTFLRNRRLYVCPNIPMTYENREYLGFDITESEIQSCGINIFDSEIDGWRVIKRLNDSFSLCRFCSNNHRNIEWSISKSPSKNDWMC